MMTRTQLYARTGAAAIAAVLALSSTQIVAQEAAQPVTTEPVTTAPAPPPATTEPVATPDPLAPTTNATETSTTKTTTTRTTGKRAARTAPAKAAPVKTQTVAHKVITHTTAHAAVPVAPVAAAAPPTAAPAPAAKPAPVVDLSAQAAAPPPQTAAARPVVQIGQNELMLGGGALALIALAAAAIALRRRRRLRLEEEEAAQYDYVEPVAEAEPMPQAESTPRHDPIFDEQPAIVAPPMSAFTRKETADCTEGETWTERAKCGPTPDNPSLSLKKRMKRAAFFEQRDREIAAGEALPVDSDAGLPEAMDDDADKSKPDLERA